MTIIHFILLALIQNFSPAQEKTSEKLQHGLQYVLTNPEILTNYGLENVELNTNCPRVVVFMISDSISSEAVKQFKHSNSCVIGAQKNEIFFYGFKAYFEIKHFSVKKHKIKLRLQLITPNHAPIGENNLFYSLDYQIVDGKIVVTKFEKIIQEYELKIKKGKKRKTDMLYVKPNND